MALTMTQPEMTTHRFPSYHRYRSWIASQHGSVQVANKVLVTLAGLTVIVVGLILVPLPGPGWLIVFFGLSILGLEFPLIHRFTSWIGAKAKLFWQWLKPKLSRK